MIVDKNRVYDGWLTLEGGVDAGRLPDTLDVNQAESARNMTFRGGSATTRPGYRKLAEKFPLIIAPAGKTGQTWCLSQSHQYNPSADIWIYGVNHTMSNPGTGHVRFNSANLETVSKMAISQTSNTGQNVEHFFDTLGRGKKIFISDQNHTARYATYELDSHPIDNGAWFLFDVTYTGPFPPTLAPADTDPLKVAFPDWGDKLLVDGEYKPVGMPLANPDPPFQTIAPWFSNQNSEYIYRHGIMQCAQVYNPHHGEDCIMAMIGGRLFKIVPGKTWDGVTSSGVKDATVSEVLIHENDVPRNLTTQEPRPRHMRNRENSPIAYMCQADKWLIIQDGDSRPIIYDATKARRTRTTNDINKSEIPTGTIMAYGMGRLVVTVNKHDVAFGDLYGSHDLPDPADSLILFTERNFLAEGFDAAIPFTQGAITGMIFFPQLDTSTGNGQLMVFAERGATSFFLSIPRDQWKSSAFQILALLTTGLRGNRSISAVNEDLWFRSDDGMRSYRQARSDSERYAWSHIPLSTNVRQYLDNDSEWLLKFCSSVYFDNRILVTTSPMWNNGRPVHVGMAVVDFDIISSFGGTASQPKADRPAWEGQWWCTKFLPIQAFTGTINGITRAFMFGMNSSGENQLYELSNDDKDDFDGNRINWELVSRSFDFNKLDPQASTVFTENELYDGDLWLKEIIE